MNSSALLTASQLFAYLLFVEFLFIFKFECSSVLTMLTSIGLELVSTFNNEAAIKYVTLLTYLFIHCEFLI